MRATKVLQKCLGDALKPVHALRRRVLLRAVEALIHGRRLTLIDVARAWPGAEHIRAPLSQVIMKRSIQIISGLCLSRGVILKSVSVEGLFRR